MIRFIHGDNQLESRNRLSELIQEAGNKEVVKLREVNLTTIKQALESSSLFAEERVVVVENIISGRVDKNVLDYLKKGLFESDLFIWEGKKMDARKLGWVKKKGRLEEYSYPKVLFKLVEVVGAVSKGEVLELFNETTSRMPVELVYFMLVRQLRLLLLISHNGVDAAIKETASLQSWMIGKFKAQASSIGQERLKKLYKQILYIDYQQKSGQANLSLKQTLDIWLSQL
ncbi:hypothetical protein COW99_03440 [Candidatus Roizmanbacteria bacterium CG22_combo_CG10-13_8_21_14_all_38_20]|uniref:DNA polymerase III delta subunit-like C-terminal domain-containing protein n=1 Tax=Candidatus Roizmanbacteria bacterium CG22_combo_CG10-13_8_21_14_all_38_20 TaxID=1974862 RepID=A0A2H0BVC6_9BACT|nr:hypothetical protein [Candidatus Microgenomates bacterium]PIP61554.1 MAG: hypothetical protein COW99_03440 [Candidatus Roizmanbacteria bacterium CG22_combo_CG10-13_8_21_14_all_38_20]PJC31508.1 MAG: hypothetical protein CO050_02905 [Candidatus Roizmanbacteria bacterium CG_4_9_14_0_2_um_filter_38_17]